MAWVAIGIAIPTIIVNVYLMWANKRRIEHDTIQREADEQ
jgi:uncharacterized iron-regulated membrane protein